MIPNPHQATAKRSGDWWSITVKGMPGVHAQARRYAGIEGAAKEAIGLYIDQDPGSIVVVVTADLGHDIDRKIRERRTLAAQLEEMQHQVAFTSRDLVLALTKDLGLSQRDAAEVLGISFQRVNQLAQ